MVSQLPPPTPNLSTSNFSAFPETQLSPFLEQPLKPLSLADPPMCFYFPGLKLSVLSFVYKELLKGQAVVLAILCLVPSRVE